MHQNFCYSLLILCLCCGINLHSHSQGTPLATNYVNNLPDFVPPSPEAAAIQKAQQLGVGYSTGAPNISIPLYALQVGEFSLPVSLNYSSTGVKVDEVASIVGMGWNINNGGVVSRVIMDKPDEDRSGTNSNFTITNPDNHDQTLLNFLKSAPDKECDIFSFSFGSYNGKFIIGANGAPIQLTTTNLKVERLTTNFTDGFLITTDDGTAYYFQDKEIVASVEPIGTNCGKTYNRTNFPNSWYLTKIVLPSTKKWIDFTYTTSNISYESSITQTISKITWSKIASCTGGNVCPVGSHNFSTCVNLQNTAAKFVSQIITSDGDKVLFTYDNRTDLSGGKRLSSIAVKNRNGILIRTISFSGSYITAPSTANAGPYTNTAAAQQRFFLNSVTIKGAEINTANSALSYSFTYNNPSQLPPRLAYSQDFYGYYNGKSANTSLVPILASTDPNYSHFTNGTAGGGVSFGNRAVDTNFCRIGLIQRVYYPTGGFDEIFFQPNKDQTGKLIGGNAVSKVVTYTDESRKAGERWFQYVYKSNNASSALLLTNQLLFSTTKRTFQNVCTIPPSSFDDYTCSNAVVSSNASNPIAVFSGQHVYFKSVLEFSKGDTADNGLVEHHYRYFFDGDLNPRLRLGNNIINAPFQVVPDLVTGETATNTYKSVGTNYSLVKSVRRTFRLDNLQEYYNYVVRRSSDYQPDVNNPPVEREFLPFDMTQVYLNAYTVRNDSIIEKEYSDAGDSLVRTQVLEYNNVGYTYPNKLRTWNSDNREERIERLYPPDVTGYTNMVSRNIISPVVQEKSFIGTATLLATKRTHFKDWFGNGKVLEADSVKLLLGANTTGQHLLFNSYDSLGNVLELSKENDVSVAYLWDYNGEEVTANIVGAGQVDFAYSSFEGDNPGNWGSLDRKKIVYDAFSPTGYKHYSTPGIYLTKSGLSSAKVYHVTYWSKGSALSVNGTQGGWPKLLRSLTLNGQPWNLYVHKVSGVTGIVVSGSGSIDELRLYPENSKLTTFTHEPMVGTTSMCDPTGRISYYEYDAMGRLALIRDEERNILKKYCYTYKGQLGNCEVFYNDAFSQSFQKNDCGNPSDFVGSYVSYTVPANRYSGVSKAEANAMAQADLAVSGQLNANKLGECRMACTNAACTGNDKKCISGICETGIKVITSSTQVHGSLWQCTYHYEWSDGSWSPNYTESQSTPCMTVIN